MILKIGEFARINQVSVAALRHYERLGLLNPVELDLDTGYRYYTLDQMPRLNRILALKELGFSLEQITRLLEEGLSFEQLRGMFQLRQAQAQQMIDTEQARLARIAARLEQIEQERKMPAYEVLLKEVDSILVASFRDIILLDNGLNQSYEKIIDYLERHHVRPSSSTSLLLLYSRSEQQEDGFYIDAETAVPISERLPGDDQITIRTLPGGLMASSIHTGANLFLGQGHGAVHLWVESNGYRVVGPPRHVRLRYGEDIYPGKYVTEVQFPVAKREIGEHM